MDFPLVLVHWDDAWADSHEGVSPDDVELAHRATKMVTVGWLLVDNERGVSLFWERCEDPHDNTFRGRTFIPRAMVTSVEVISGAPKRRKKKDANDGTGHTNPV